jgi:DNA-binding Xre family transcriptional regulator
MGSQAEEEGSSVAPKLDYRWNLRQVMASRGMFATTDLIGPLAQRGIRLSSSQVYRLVAERPERLSLKVLMALLDILGCTMQDLVEPVATALPARKASTASGGGSGIGGLRPKPARITRASV